MRSLAPAFAALLLAACAPPTTETPVAAVEAFGQALAAGDREAALARLAPDLLVYEFGGQEASRDEYAAGHLASDMEFLRGVKVSTLDRRQAVHGDAAIVTTRTRATGRRRSKSMCGHKRGISPGDRDRPGGSGGSRRARRRSRRSPRWPSAPSRPRPAR